MFLQTVKNVKHKEILQKLTKVVKTFKICFSSDKMKKLFWIYEKIYQLPMITWKYELRMNIDYGYF